MGFQNTSVKNVVAIKIIQFLPWLNIMSCSIFDKNSVNIDSMGAIFFYKCKKIFLIFFSKCKEIFSQENHMFY